MESAKECDLLLNDCAQQMDCIQQQIERITGAIKADGPQLGHTEKLKILI